MTVSVESHFRCLAPDRRGKLNVAKGTDMKRPQFSLRLMLLVVTLLATILAWHQVDWENRAGERQNRIYNLSLKIAARESWLGISRRTPGADRFPPAKKTVAAINAEIAEMKAEIESLK
jgi:hypothetical protein